MTRRNKKILIIGVILFLLITNISALITMYYQNHVIEQRNNPEREIPRREVQPERMRQFLRDEFQFTNEQFEHFSNINEKNARIAKKYGKELNILRNQFIDEMSKENPDDQLLDQYAVDMGKIHTEIKRNSIKHFQELKAICNDEQVEVLKRMFRGMVSEDHPKFERYRKHRRGDRRMQGKDKGKERRNRDKN